MQFIFDITVRNNYNVMCIPTEVLLAIYKYNIICRISYVRVATDMIKKNKKNCAVDTVQGAVYQNHWCVQQQLSSITEQQVDVQDSTAI